MENVYITSAVRTPIGSFQGTLSSLTGPQLGAHVIKEALKQSLLIPEQVHECIMGEVLTAGVGQAPARQAAIYAGLPPSVTCMTINKVCGSGLKAVMLGADAIRLNPDLIVVAGGQESMSQTPHLMENSRQGYRMGSVPLVDSLIKDGLWDPFNNWHMGNAGELCSKEHHFTREAQDEFAINSYKKAQSAQANQYFKNEIAVLTLPSKKETLLIEKDEEPGNAKFDKMATLKPAFDKQGTITAANASKLNDGASALVLMSESQIKSKSTKPLAKIISYTSFAQDPKWFTTAPVGAIKNALNKAHLQTKDIDFWEINEAFSVVTMVAAKELQISADRINPHGGAVALGHPIGASGARVLTTLVHALHTHKKRYGLATLCIGGGEAVAMIIEKMES